MRDRRRSNAASAPEWPAAIRQIVLAAEHECPNGHANALHDMLALALVKVPSRGIFDPTCRGEDELFSAIEATALAHLDLAGARRAWRHAIAAAAMDTERRDLVEAAALEVQTASDTAYYYAGLAFGLVAVSVYR
jgi:hypothetical protein